MTRWHPSDKFIGGKRAIELTRTGELSLSGKYGELWIDGENYKAIITAPKIANKLFIKNKDDKLRIGDELLIKFGKERLKEIIKVIKVPKNIEDQVDLANNFGK